MLLETLILGSAVEVGVFGLAYVLIFVVGR